MSLLTTRPTLDLLGSFRGLAEKDPEEDLIGSRVVVAVFTLEAFDVFVFE